MRRRIFENPARQSYFEEHGYVSLPVLDQTQVEALLKATAMLKPADGYAPADRYHCSFLDSRTDYKRAAFTLLRQSFAPFIAATLPGFMILSANFYVKPPGRGELPPHQNWPALSDLDDTSVTLWCPLVDCDVENGTVHLVPGSHKLVPYVQSPGTSTYFASFVPELIRDYLRPMPTRAGDGIVFDDSLIHWSPDNGTERPRIAVQLLCVPADAQHVYFLLDGEGGFERIAVDPAFYTDQSMEMLRSRQPGWRSLGHAHNNNRPLSERKFARLLASARRRRAETSALMTRLGSAPSGA